MLCLFFQSERSRGKGSGPHSVSKSPSRLAKMVVIIVGVRFCADGVMGEEGDSGHAQAAYGRTDVGNHRQQARSMLEPARLPTLAAQLRRTLSSLSKSSAGLTSPSTACQRLLGGALLLSSAFYLSSPLCCRVSLGRCIAGWSRSCRGGLPQLMKPLHGACSSCSPLRQAPHP